MFMMFLTFTGLKTNELSPDDVEFVVYMMFLIVTGLKTNRLTPDVVVFMMFLIVTGLKTNELSPDDVEFVVCTHGHSDHVGNLNLFTHATHIVSYDICVGDRYLMHEFKEVCKIFFLQLEASLENELIFSHMLEFFT